ncbi:glycosyltransferase [Flammeovirga sp. MY04]|uniref:glycosyltransferase n=1 Tax=Flammeovirga sp. MY04 TaxID=1191459 RepID=UPI00080610E8|nr:glycosyltransferase [Flammeovirga sp. MY04]ANQ48285.1 glycosyltransferase [Flammeovirga sp. MY04]
MKVVHISTYPRGGAANAALRFHNGLLQLGVDSKVLCRDEGNKEQKIYSYGTSINFRRISTIYKNLKILPHFYMEDDQCEGFSSPLSLYKLEKHPIVVEADIVILHWVANFINYPSFFKNINKKVIWYLHDMNPFQGGFHYNEDHERFKKFNKVDQLFYNIKKKALNDTKLTVMAPSQWLLDLSKKSELLGRFNHKLARYGLSTEKVIIHDQIEVRKKFKLPLDHKVLLFVSERISNTRKGAMLLINALKKCDLQEKVSILVVGDYDKDLFESDHLHTVGRLHSVEEMAMAYSAADLFVLPSREDNLPNVMLESLYCGTPVMAFKDGGGMKEIIHDKNGKLIDDMNEEALAEALQQWIDQPFDFEREDIRAEAVTQFEEKQQALKLKEELEKIMSL